MGWNLGGSLRFKKRIISISSSATPSINTDVTDVFKITALAVDITSMTTNLTGTPVDGDELHIIIVPTAQRAITWGASFESSSCVLPVTAWNGYRVDIKFIWNPTTSKWRCMAVA